MPRNVSTRHNEVTTIHVDRRSQSAQDELGRHAREVLYLNGELEFKPVADPVGADDCTDAYEVYWTSLSQALDDSWGEPDDFADSLSTGRTVRVVSHDGDWDPDADPEWDHFADWWEPGHQPKVDAAALAAPGCMYPVPAIHGCVIDGTEADAIRLIEDRYRTADHPVVVAYDLDGWNGGPPGRLSQIADKVGQTWLILHLRTADIPKGGDWRDAVPPGWFAPADGASAGTGAG